MLMELPGITSINKTEDLLLALAVSDTVACNQIGYITAAP